VKTPIESMLLVLTAAFIGSFGAVFLKLGAERLRRNWRSLLLNTRLIAGVALFGCSSVFFVMGVQRGELSVLYPMIATGYIWTLFWSRLFFGEPITRHKFWGLVLILVGIGFIGAGNS
jgi:drug/metabolite transporter (DMT)-like permease